MRETASVLVAGDALRRIVQTETPRGRYALVFASLATGDDGQPHPSGDGCGLWQLAEVE